MKKNTFITLILFLVFTQLLTAQTSIMKINNTFERNNVSQPVTSRSESGKKAATEKFDIETLPALTNILGSGVVAPSIDLMGSKSTDSGIVHGSIDLFSASLANKNSDSIAQTNYLFLPEASTFGLRIGARFTRGNKYFLEDQKDHVYKDHVRHLSFNTEVNFLRKRLIQEDKSVFEPFVFHFKLGGEWMPLKDWVSFYANISYILPVTQNRDFKTYAPQIKDNLVYLECGAKFELEISGVNTFFDFNFIAINDRVKTITKTSDKVIPSIRIGISKSIFN